MDVERIKHIMNSVMILSFLIFGGLFAIILITDVRLNNITTPLPFAFLFISLATFIITSQINEKPKLVHKYMRDWLIICTIGIIIAALALTLY
ncbi:hypothetical protein EU527_00170 [Candidatus Thorarchaeota archaeon]|nr:MAG: hypothetical protein EU527_00170 [Candidatus Thorarchaeota archaeon]